MFSTAPDIKDIYQIVMNVPNFEIKNEKFISNRYHVYKKMLGSFSETIFVLFAF